MKKAQQRVKKFSTGDVDRFRYQRSPMDTQE